MAASHGTAREHGGALMRRPIAWAIGLVALHALLFVLRGAGQFVADLPWYVPLTHGFAALAAICTSFLAVGRYRVLDEPAPSWIATAFGSFAFLSVFYILSWSGLLPDGRGLIARSPNTSGWLFNFKIGVPPRRSSTARGAMSRREYNRPTTAFRARTSA